PPAGPLKVVRSGPAVTVKFAEAVDPVTYAAPVPSVAMALPTSSPEPRRNVMYLTLCSSISNLATNASRLPPGVGDGWRDLNGPPPAVGKFVENVPVLRQNSVRRQVIDLAGLIRRRSQLDDYSP